MSPSCSLFSGSPQAYPDSGSRSGFPTCGVNCPSQPRKVRARSERVCHAAEPGPEPGECCPKEVTPLLRCLSETFAEFGLSILPASSGQPLKKEWESSPQTGVSPQQPDQTPSSGCVSGPGLRHGADTAGTQPRASPGPEGREGAGRVARRPDEEAQEAAAVLLKSRSTK